MFDEQLVVQVDGCETHRNLVLKLIMRRRFTSLHKPSFSSFGLETEITDELLQKNWFCSKQNIASNTMCESIVKLSESSWKLWASWQSYATFNLKAF